MKAPSLRERFIEWFVGHGLWELCKVALTAGFAWLISIGGAHLWHAATSTAFNIFLVVIGILGVAWVIGVVPIRVTNKPSISQ